jgi:copper ion binding protein
MEGVRIKKQTFLVEGMTCSGCERTVSKVVGNLEGVKSSKADLSTSTVWIEYDPARVTIDQIKSAVNKVGYKFVGERPSNGAREGSDEAIS